VAGHWSGNNAPGERQQKDAVLLHGVRMRGARLRQTDHHAVASRAL